MASTSTSSSSDNGSSPGNDDEAEIRALKIYKALQKFNPNFPNPPDTSSGITFLGLSPDDYVVVRTQADPGEWVHVEKFKKPAQFGYVPMDFLERIYDESQVKKYVADHQKALTKLDQERQKGKKNIPEKPKIPGAIPVLAWKNLETTSTHISSNKKFIKTYKQSNKFADGWKKANKAFSNGEIPQAISLFKELAHKLNHASIFFNIAICYLQLKDWGNAIFQLNNAINLNPSFAIAIFVRATTYYKRKDYLQAILDFSTVLNLFKESETIDYRPLNLDFIISRGEVFYNRSLAFASLGITVRALEDIQHAMRHRFDHRKHFIMSKLRNELARESGEGASGFLVPHGLKGFSLFAAPPPNFGASRGTGGSNLSSSSKKKRAPAAVNPLMAEMFKGKT